MSPSVFRDGADGGPIPPPSAYLPYGFKGLNGASTKWAATAHIYGAPLALSKKYKRAVLLMPGWPDKHEAMAPLAARLAEREGDGTACAVICMPGYDDPSAAFRARPAGFTIDEVVASVEAAAEALLAFVELPKLTLVLHDWGCYFGGLFSNRRADLVDRIVLIDVGLAPSKAAPKGTDAKKQLAPVQGVVSLARGAFYQLWFAAGYLVSRLTRVSAAGTFVFRLYVLLATLVPFIGVQKAGVPGTRLLRPRSEVTGWLGYPYYMVWKHILTGQSPPKPRLPDDLDATPVAFLFGTEKRLFFHGSSFLAQLDGGARCLTRAFKCGHWVMDAYPEEVAEAVSGFLSA